MFRFRPMASVADQGEAKQQLIGQLQIASFINPEGLTKRGENLF